MRWYGTPRFFAARVKKSTLRRDSASVTLTLSSRGTRASGAGRKSAITRTGPISPAVYLTVLSVIDFLSFAPITRPEYANAVVAPCEANRHHAAVHPAEAKIALLRSAMA